jgi:hypothetical protein
MGCQRLRRSIPILVLATVAVILAGCPSTVPITRNEPGTTYGEIYVGFPRVAGRERLVNDRLEQERWLADQLNKIDEQSLGFDGLTDIRNLLYSSAQLKLQVDPAYKLYAEQQAQALQGVRAATATEESVQQLRLAAVQQITAKFNKQELTADQAKVELEKIGVRLQDVSVGSNINPTTPPSANSATPSVDKDLPGKVLLNSANTSSPYTPPSGSSANSANLQGSPIDRFRDLIAVRDEIRTARIENALDDAHDIKGNTLYRLTFDVTVRPRPDTSALAIVELTAKPVPDTNPELVERFRRAFEIDSRNRVDDLWKQIRQKLEFECTEVGAFSEVIECALGELSTVDQNYIWTALNQNPTWASSNTVIKRRDGLKTLTVTSSLLIKQLLIDAESVRLDDSRASCYLSVERNKPTSIISPFFPNQSTRPRADFDIVRAQTDVRVTLVKGAAPDNPIEGKLRDLRLARYSCQDFQDQGSLEKAIAGFLLPSSTIRAYAVTPRESVQRLSEVSGNRNAREFLLGLSALAPGGGLGAAFQQLSANDALYQAVRRQPVVVGFNDTQASKAGETRLGWILGPQFQLSDNGQSVRFRHAAKQQPVSATISVPAWLGQVSICARAYWLTESGQKISADGSQLPYSAKNECDSNELIVSLPQKSSTLVSQSYEGVLQRRPTTTVRQRLALTEDEPAKVIIMGTNLWRSTEVYIGAQRADVISLTPDMQGVQAIFNRIDAPSGRRTPDGRVDLTVFTSEGSVQAGTVAITRTKEPATVTAQGFSRRLVADQVSTFDLGTPLGAYSSAEVHIQNPQNTKFDVNVTDLRIAQDERRVSFTPPGSAFMGMKAGELLNVIFRVKRSPDSQFIDIPVAKNVVYFPSADAMKVGIAFVGGGKTLPLSMNLNFSSAVMDGFSALAAKRVRIIATATLDGEQLPLHDSICELTKNTCRLKITGSPGVTKKIADSKNNWKVQLAFADEDAPSFDKPELEITR